MGIFNRPKIVVQEVIGRVSLMGSALRRRFVARSVDQTQADYAFWDRLQRGLEPTYKLGGLFAKPVVQHIVSWSMGKAFTVKTGSDSTDEEVGVFVKNNLRVIMDTIKTSKSLGDGYLVVNADGTLTQVPPDQVEIVTDMLDYRTLAKVMITTRLDKATITDEYRLDGRTVRIKRHDDGTEEVIEYGNVTGRLPVIHFPNERGVNELYGHSTYETMLPMLAEYDDVLNNSLAGVKAMSNPRPVLEGVEDPGAEMKALATGSETYLDANGDERTALQVDLSGNEMIATSGSFNMKAPSSFTADSWRMLKGLFYLMLQHVNIPEWLWGGHIESSNASVDAQLPAFTRFIDWVRLDIETPLRDLVEVWLATVALYTPGIVATDDLDIEWPSLSDEDRELRLKEINYAHANGLITDETALMLMDLVEDAGLEVAAAKEQAQERKEAFDASLDAEVARLQQEEAQGQEPGEDQQGSIADAAD